MWNITPSTAGYSGLYIQWPAIPHWRLRRKHSTQEQCHVWKRFRIKVRASVSADHEWVAGFWNRNIGIQRRDDCRTVLHQCLRDGNPSIAQRGLPRKSWWAGRTDIFMWVPVDQVSILYLRQLTGMFNETVFQYHSVPRSTRCCWWYCSFTQTAGKDSALWVNQTREIRIDIRTVSKFGER